MYHVSAQGIDECMINVHYYYYFPYEGQGPLVFSLVAAAFWIPPGTCGSVRKKQCAKFTWMHDFKSHFQQDFLAYCTRPVSVHLAIACVSCSFDSFSIFLLSLKQQQNLVKIMLPCIHFPVWPYPPQIMRKNPVFYTGKLYGLTGMLWDNANHGRTGSKHSSQRV